MVFRLFEARYKRFDKEADLDAYEHLTVQTMSGAMIGCSAWSVSVVVLGFLAMVSTPHALPAFWAALILGSPALLVTLLHEVNLWRMPTAEHLKPRQRAISKRLVFGLLPPEADKRALPGA